ncbi:MAG: hypothetical protein TEF_00330 [Rhizobiales bacterium NRL2]|jgi:hypothetical protein|nr:MAG: hypothetical protein TEF_00330 [Rhizobiales bacterium NRL2]
MIPAIIAAALPLVTEFLPSIGRLINGENGERVATKVVDVARRVTGAETPEQAIERLRADPKLVAELQRQATAIELAEIDSEVDRHRQVNETMRAEIASDDPYVRRWRPTLGYAVAITWALTMLGLVFIIGWVAITEPREAPNIFIALGDAIASIAPIWLVALSVLGVSVWKRSEDKKTAAGVNRGPGVIGSILGRLTGRDGS